MESLIIHFLNNKVTVSELMPLFKTLFMMIYYYSLIFSWTIALLMATVRSKSIPPFQDLKALWTRDEGGTRGDVVSIQGVLRVESIQLTKNTCKCFRP